MKFIHAGAGSQNKSLAAIRSVVTSFSFFVMTFSSSFFFFLAAAAAADNDCLEVGTVEEFDLMTYTSQPWYVQQQAENFYTPRGLDKCVTANYNIREKETFWGYTVDVVNSAEQREDGQQRGATLCADYDNDTPSQLRVAPCFVPKFLAGPYWVIAYREDNDNDGDGDWDRNNGGYALVSGGPPRFEVDDDTTCGETGTEQCCKTGDWINNSGLWILTRQPNPTPDLIDEVRAIARRKGFSTTSEVLFPVEQTDCGYDDIPATAIANGAFTTLVTALEVTELVGPLSQPFGDFTVFAPTDAAFAALPEGLVDCLLNDIPTLTKILTYHVASGEVVATQLTNGMEIPTLEGQTVTVTIVSDDDGEDVVKINESTVSIPDVPTSNGVIHVLDEVLVPPDVDVGGYLETCVPVPPIPPCEDDRTKFNYKGRMKACKWVKKQLNRNGIKFCNKRIGPKNNNNNNNQIHIKDLCPVTCGTCLLDLPGTAIANGSFQTLVTALTAAGLVEVLSEPNGEFTIFAPTDDAFAALPEDLVGCLLKDKYKDVLTKILTYHVASGTVVSSQLSNGQEITTLEGQTVTVELVLSDDGGGVKINDSTVSIPDVEASNGVIHVLDQVLVPADIDVAAFLGVCTLDDIPTTAAKNGSFKTLVAALDAADLVEAVSEPKGPYTVFAPTDEAFAALPAGLISCLLNDIDTLSKILLYHVANGQVLSTQLTGGSEIVTLEGQNVFVDLRDGVKIDESTVVIADVPTTNGVIHAIDTVLVPPDVDVTTYLETCDGTAQLPPPCEDDPEKFQYKPGKMRACKWVKKQLNKNGFTFCDKSIGNGNNKLHIKDVCPVTCEICSLN